MSQVTVPPAIGNQLIGGTVGSVLFVGAGNTLGQDNANFFWDDTNNRLGLGTAAPAASLHGFLSNTQATSALFTTSDWVDGTTGSELQIRFGAASGNTYSIINASDGGGSSAAGLAINSDNLGNVGVHTTAATSIFHVQSQTDYTGTTTPVAFDVNAVAGGDLTASSGTQTWARFAPNVNQTGTASTTSLLVETTETAVGSGAQRLLYLKTAAADRFRVFSGGTVAVNTGNYTPTVANAAGLSGVGIAVSGPPPGLSGSILAGLYTNQPINTALDGVGAYINYDHNGASAATYQYGCFIRSVVSAGTVTTNYSLFLDTANGATNNYGLIVEGTNSGFNIIAPTSIVHIQQAADSTDTTNPIALDVDSVGAAGELTAASGTQTFAAIAPRVNQSGTAAYQGLLINSTETAVGSGITALFDAQLAGTSKFRVNSGGSSTAAPTIVMSATTNQQILTAATSYTGQALVSYSNAGTGSGDDLRFIIGVNGATAGDPFIQFNISGIQNWHIGIDNSQNDNLTFGLGTSLTTPKMSMDTTGQLGIGLVTPTSVLHVQQSTQNVSDSAQTATPVIADFNSVGAAAELTAASGTQTFFRIAPIYNQTGTAAGTDLLINRTQTAVGSGNQRLLDMQVGGVSQAYFNNLGNLFFLNGAATEIYFTGSGSGTTITTESSYLFRGAGGATASTWTTFGTVNAISNSSGTATTVAITPTYNQTSTAAGTDLLINRTETAIGSGSQYLIDLQVGGVSKARIDNAGTLYCSTIQTSGSADLWPQNNDETLNLQGRNFTAAGSMVTMAIGTTSHSSGTVNAVAITPTHNQTSTAAATDLLINRTQTVVGSGAQLLIDAQVGGSSRAKIDNTGKVTLDSTVTAGGTTGNQTINKPSGTVNFAAAATALTVTNSTCTANSLVLCELRTNDATARIANVVPGSGTFTINLTAAATAETSCGFVVFN